MKSDSDINRSQHIASKQTVTRGRGVKNWDFHGDILFEWPLGILETDVMRSRQTVTDICDRMWLLSKQNSRQ